jgi:MFS superfamily sulfate permease-like transporter
MDSRRWTAAALVACSLLVAGTVAQAQAKKPNILVIMGDVHDAVAGVTLAAYGIPVSLAYASLAGLPPQDGVYCYLVGGLLYGALLFRVEASLLYFNVDHVRDAVWERIRSLPAPPRLVVCDLSMSPVVDLAGARMLATLHAELQAAGISLRLVSAHAAVRDLLRAEGLEERVGYFGRRISVADAIDEEIGGRPAPA